MNGHVIVADLGYGDAGKGTIVDWLCARTARGAGRPAHAVVRFNGGAQAAHHVLSPDGRVHAFSQFGSGTFTPGVRTFLSRYALVDPLALTAEAAHLRDCAIADPFRLLAVDRDALLTTPYHQDANRAREAARGADRHGSCGMGIGETARYALDHPADAPRAGDMTTPRLLARKLTLLRDRLRDDLIAAGVPARDGVLAGTGQGRLAPDVTAPPPADVAAVYRAVADRVTLAGDGYLAGLLRVCRAYDTPAGRVTRLSPGPYRDLAYQEGLTATLLRARPVYDQPLQPDDWPDAVAEIAAAPVTVRSYGPSAADKTAAHPALARPRHDSV